MKQRVEEMEMEAKKLRELQAAAEQANSMEGEDGSAMETEEEKAAADGRSIYVGNVCRQNSTMSPHFANSLKVDYSATPEEIQGHFQACGTINRVTILCDKFTGHPKGYVQTAATSSNINHPPLPSQICVRRIRRTRTH